MQPLPSDLVERRLATWPVARLATRTPDGRPHLVPIVFAWHGGALWSPIDGKPKGAGGAELARVRHVARDPRVSVLLDHYDPDWRRLWWIRVDGRAVPRPPLPEVEAVLRAKYPQYAEVPLFRGEPTLLRIEPERVTSWRASELPSLGS